MPNNIRLFERPLVADEVQPALMVTGVLPDYIAGDAYEGRLSIINSVGRCKVEVLESTLPPGAFVRVDNVTKEVVVKWAAYTEVEEPITEVPGGDFEDGGDSSIWSMGNGWSIGTGPDYDVKTGAYSARFAGVKTKGSDMISPRVPAKVNDYIRVTTQVQQGASAKGNAGARVSLIYRNEAGAELLRLWGNLVSSGSGGAWNASTAEGAAPADTATVEVVISAYRNRENFALWVDDVSWNHKYTLGQDNDDSYFLSIKVTDSENRVAYWSGAVEEYALYLTSRLFPVSGDFDLLSVAGRVISGELRDMPVFHADDDRATVSAAVVAGELRLPIVTAYGGGDSLSAEATVVGGSLRYPILERHYEPEALSLTARVAQGVLKTTLLTRHAEDDKVATSAKVIGGALT